jgi:hypothetical protein
MVLNATWKQNEIASLQRSTLISSLEPAAA